MTFQLARGLPPGFYLFFFHPFSFQQLFFIKGFNHLHAVAVSFSSSSVGFAADLWILQTTTNSLEGLGRISSNFSTSFMATSSAQQHLASERATLFSPLLRYDTPFSSPSRTHKIFSPDDLS